MEKVRIVFNSPGFREILLSEGTKELVETTAQDIADRANANSGGDGFEASTIVGGYGGGRYIGFVTATTEEAMKAEAENGALTGAIL